ncbi:MAG: hypothetical protein NC111_02850 [Bacteroides sp.]|nr:hypothetical protein [Bacteroides sp.]MCM1413233.1 hypothetical protein [Bacteroides sp.]MCM1471457.1 hypothetical protein [Bacteroides sp.]
MNHADNKRIARNTFFLYGRTFVTMLIGLYTSRKILEALGVVDFGIYNIVGGVIAMMAMLSGSMNVGVSRFLTVELGRKDFEGYRRVFNMSLLIQMSIAGIVLLLAETVGLWFVNTHLVIPPERMAAANWVYQATIIVCVLSIISSPYGATINAHERMHIYAYLGMGESVAKLLIVISLFWCPWDRLPVWSIAMSSVSLISMIIQVAYCRRQFPYCKLDLRWDRSLFRDMASFSGWNMFGTIAWTLKDQGQNIVLNLFGGPLINAARGVSFQVRGAIGTLTGGFQSAINPQLTKNIAADDRQSAHRLMFKSSKISYFLLLIPAIPICYEINYLLGLWLVKVPDYAALFTILVVCESLCEVFGSPAITMLLATGRIKWYQIVVGIVLMLNIPIAYLLLWLGLPIYVPFLVSIALVIAGQCARLMFCRSMTGMSLRTYAVEVVWRCLLVTIVSLFVPTLIIMTMPTGFGRLALMAVATVAATCLAVWALGLNSSERRFVSEIIHNRLSPIIAKFQPK